MEDGALQWQLDGVIEQLAEEQRRERERRAARRREAAFDALGHEPTGTPAARAGAEPPRTHRGRVDSDYSPMVMVSPAAHTPGSQAAPEANAPEAVEAAHAGALNGAMQVQRSSSEDAGQRPHHPTGLPPQTATGCMTRVIADSSNRVTWLRARSQGITATDAATLATDDAIYRAVRAKLYPTGFSGNSFTDHGRAREPHIAAWVQERFGIEPSTLLFHAADNRLHLATPDGVQLDGERAVLAEIKTTTKAWKSIPRNYLRQIWWQQYVLGAERTLIVWEEHRDFVPVEREPRFSWVERDERAIATLRRRADRVLELIAEHDAARMPSW